MKLKGKEIVVDLSFPEWWVGHGEWWGGKNDDDVVICKDEERSWHIMRGRNRWRGVLQHHGWVNFLKHNQVNIFF